MRLLFDTHAFIWWNSKSRRLSAKALAACEDPANRLLVSVVSLWEIQIKLGLNKLELDAPLETVIAVQQKENQLEILPVYLDHILALSRIPAHHRDPLDRLIATQANFENATLISHDSAMSDYPVQVLW